MGIGFQRAGIKFYLGGVCGHVLERLGGYVVSLKDRRLILIADYWNHFDQSICLHVLYFPFQVEIVCLLFLASTNRLVHSGFSRYIGYRYIKNNQRSSADSSLILITNSQKDIQMQ